jgi:hypothetical protein
MEPTTTTPSTGTTLEILLAYPPGLKCRHRAGIDGEIAGFDFREPTGVCIEYLSEQGKWETDWVEPIDLLPVLYAFEDLINPLPSGEIPAVEVAKLGMDDRCSEIFFRSGYEIKPISADKWGNDTHPDTTAIEVWGKYTACAVLTISSKWDFYYQAGGPTARAIDYLRRHHFAIGLTPHQYVRKTPASAPTP